MSDAERFAKSLAQKFEVELLKHAFNCAQERNSEIVKRAHVQDAFIEMFCDDTRSILAESCRQSLVDAVR